MKCFCSGMLFGGLLMAAVSVDAQKVDAQKQTPVTAPQVRKGLPSYEGQNVVSVEVAGRPDLDKQQLRPLLLLREGDPFSQSKVDQSIAALKNSGQVKEVQVEMRPQANGIRVLLICQPAVYFGIFDFPGASGRFAYSRLLQVADYPPRGAYSPVDVQNAQASLTRFFQQNGYFEVQVKPEIQTDTVHQLVNVHFHVSLNRHAKFGKVIFKGAPPEEEQRLQRALKSYLARVRGTAIRAGKPYSL